MVEKNLRIGRELVESIEMPSVGEFVEDTTEDFNDVARLVKTSVEEARDQVVESYHDLFKDIMADVDMRTSRAKDVINDLYSTLNFTNFRLPPVLKQFVPDFSPLTSLCPTVSQSKCTKCSLPLVLCRLCCPSLSETPISVTDWASESSSSTSISNLLSSSFSLAGLHMIYQSWLDPRKPHTAAKHSVIKFINKFNQLAGNDEMIKVDDVTSLSSMPPTKLCGYYVSGSRSERIVGGTNVQETGHHPWQLSLATGLMGMWYQHRCGAAVLTRYWALTAAHCVNSLGYSNLYLMGGFLNINSRQTAQIRRVDNIISHSGFDEVSYEQDIALLHMAEPLVLTTKLLPVCLPWPTSGYTGKMATLAGWGRQGHNKAVTRQLQEVSLPVISNDECMAWFNETGSRQWIPEETFLCAGWESGEKDACSGDSGGPLTLVREDGRVEVAGVVSWGIGCGSAGRPGVYTRVTSYVDWIKRTIDYSGE